MSSKSSRTHAAVEQEPTPPARAVKLLRSRLGVSQQAFAKMLGLSLRAIANYEAGRAPTLKSLISLAHLARLYHYHDLEEIFTEALLRALQPPAGWIAARAAHEAGEWHGYLHAHVVGLELSKMLLTVATVLRLAQAPNESTREAARELLRKLNDSFREAQQAGVFSSWS
ncbi:MAG: helix-turn-helix transcriptional regulator [Bryobacterales bacterium]|nr:helix-turn-helix domain-containing protein [Bryobacteraceae bacterium]MDW8356159.1 helix-turn-helix transcriptional regulator [Bryobacterales bacterium]